MNRFHSRFANGHWLGVVAIWTLAGCDLPGRPNPADRPVPPDRVLTFTALYGRNCAGCHGADGKMGPAPPLNDPLFRALIPEEEVAKTVAEGRPGTLMPAFSQEHGGPLTAPQIAVIVKDIKGIPYRVLEAPKETEVEADPEGVRPVWGQPDSAPADAPPYLAPQGKAGEAAAGADVLARACAACHGDRGQGVLQDGVLLRTIHNPAFLSLLSDQALRRIAVTGRADLGMPDYAHRGGDYPNYKPLTSQDVTNVVALLAAWRREGTTADDKPRGAP